MSPLPMKSTSEYFNMHPSIQMIASRLRGQRLRSPRPFVLIQLWHNAKTEIEFQHCGRLAHIHKYFFVVVDLDVLMSPLRYPK